MNRDTPLDRIAELMDPLLAEKDWGLDWPSPETRRYLDQLRQPVLANVEAAREQIAAFEKGLMADHRTICLLRGHVEKQREALEELDTLMEDIGDEPDSQGRAICRAALKETEPSK